MPQAAAAAVEWIAGSLWEIGAIETGTAVGIMANSAAIANTALLVGGLAYSASKARSAKQAAKDAYNASQDKVNVRLESQGVNYDELRRNYDTAASAGQLPTMVAGEDTWTQYMIDNGKTLPAQACIEADDDERAKIDDVLPGITAAYSVNGVQWPAAFGASTVVLYYNKAHFTAAGLDPEKPPTTLTELRAAADALKKVPAPEGPGAEPLAMKLDPWFVENMLSANDQTLVDHDNGRDGSRATKATLKSESATTALDWLANLKQDGLLNAIQEVLFIERLLQEIKGTITHGAGHHGHIPMGRYKNDGNGATKADETLLKPYPAEARHTHVQNETMSLLKGLGIGEHVDGARKVSYRKPKGLDKQTDGQSDRIIVIHNANQWCLHISLLWLMSAAQPIVFL